MKLIKDFMIFTISLAMAFTIGGCASSSVSAISDRLAVEDVLVEFAVQTDAKDWKAVQALFAPKIKYPPPTAEESVPSIFTPPEMTARWEKRLKECRWSFAPPPRM